MTRPRGGRENTRIRGVENSMILEAVPVNVPWLPSIGQIAMNRAPSDYAEALPVSHAGEIIRELHPELPGGE